MTGGTQPQSTRLEKSAAEWTIEGEDRGNATQNGYIAFLTPWMKEPYMIIFTFIDDFEFEA